MRAVTDELRAESPLAPFAARFAATRGTTLAERPLAQVDLRGDPADAGFLAAVQGVLGAAPPLAANTAAAFADGAILWLGPDEWLVVAAGDSGALAARLAAALAGRHVAVTDVSSNRAVIELAGPRAADVLAKGCGLDLHPDVFRPGQCAQTLLARAQVILHRPGDAPAWRLHVRGSFAAYLAGWLLDAAGEYQAS
jgi:sarcosine oxidase subunit gamma